jgi:hypothetical protein
MIWILLVSPDFSISALRLPRKASSVRSVKPGWQHPDAQSSRNRYKLITHGEKKENRIDPCVRKVPSGGPACRFIADTVTVIFVMARGTVLPRL